MLKEAHANVNSLPRKTPLVQQLMVDSKIHVFCVTETHLLSSMPSSFIHIPGYSVIRSDVMGSYAKHGACIYIQENIKHVKLEVPVQNCVAVKLVDLNLLVVAVYRPPSNSDQENTALIQYLSDICSENEALVMGDFNLPSLTWNQSPAPVAGVDKLFLDAFLTLALTFWL